MSEFAIETITSVIGMTGFLIFFRISAKNAPPALLCGILTMICSHILEAARVPLFFSVLASAVFASLLSEAAARIWKAPSNVFLIPALVPLLPGASLYYTIFSLIRSHYESFIEYGLNTVYSVFGIALGILIASVIFEYFLLITKLKSRRK